MEATMHLRETQATPSRLRIRLVTLALSVGGALLSTLLLLLVWEMRIDGKDYRRLYPWQLVLTILVGISGVGCALLWNEIARKFTVRLVVYPILATCYLGTWIAATYFLTYDFAISCKHPLIASQQSADGQPATRPKFDLRR